MESNLQNQINELKAEFDLLRANSTIPFDIAEAFKARLEVLLLESFSQSLPTGFTNAPLALVTSPTGGATVDTQARTAINAIISRLEDLGLILPN